MFGFVAADAGALSEEEKERYRAVYCGLCLALRDRYGQLSRACLTYDLTFFVLLCNSLHEPVETKGASHCVMHPAPAAPRPWARSTWTDYAADLSVALAYHKVLDDIADDGALKARAAERLLKNYINSIESGQNYPALEGFFNICDYLHVDPFTFFYTDDNTYQSFAYFIPLLQKLNSEEIQHVYQMVKNVTEYPSRQTKTKANRFIPTK